MKTVTVAELNNNLSLYLRQVRQGKEITIKERHRVIAGIVPARSSDHYEQELVELAARGKVKSPERLPDPDLWRTLKPAKIRTGERAGQDVLSQTIDEERTFRHCLYRVKV